MLTSRTLGLKKILNKQYYIERIKYKDNIIMYTDMS